MDLHKVVVSQSTFHPPTASNHSVPTEVGLTTPNPAPAYQGSSYHLAVPLPSYTASNAGTSHYSSNHNGQSGSSIAFGEYSVTDSTASSSSGHC
jgi:hypothetical protein